MSQLPTMPSAVQTVFDQYPKPIYEKLLSLRTLVYEVAERINGVGSLEETLKWGQPSFLTSETKSGTTLRIDQPKNDPDHIALYVNCQTTLIETFRSRYPDLTYEGSRAIHLAIDTPLPTEALEDCIGMILTYHLRKKR